MTAFHVQLELVTNIYSLLNVFKLHKKVQKEFQVKHELGVFNDWHWKKTDKGVLMSTLQWIKWFKNETWLGIV